MNLLLDTPVLLWWAHDSPSLAERERDAIASADRVFLSSVVIWEVEIKRAIGRLTTIPDLRERALGAGLLGLSFTLEHAGVAGRLERHHDDPFDRALVAQARCESLILVTADAALDAYGVARL